VSMKSNQIKCPKCKTQNLRTRKFCRECGEKLLSPCAWCGHENHRGDRFCGECGHSLFVQTKSTPPKASSRGFSWDEKLARFQKYLPQGLTQKILAQKDKIEGERKMVTILFCDMVDSTPLAARLGQEEVYALMDEVFEILIHQIHAYEGTINKTTGDGVMALFGAPIALEDAPQRAVRSALAICKEMNRLSGRLKEEKGIPPIRMRSGIHTGPVVVGTLGSDLRVEFNAVGDTVNLASRMEGLAEAGTILVSEETYRLTEGFFRFDFQGEKRVKGKESPVKAYRVIGPKPRKTRFEVSAEKGLTSFVGRERELDLLLEGFKKAKDGRGEVFSVVAEAGMGKSRLLFEFRKALAGEDHTFLEGRCLSFGRGMAYHPVIEILKKAFDVPEGDEEGEVSRKVRERLKTLQGEDGVHLPYLLELLSVKDSGIDKIFLSPDARKNRIVEAFKWITLKITGSRLPVVVFEDLHWMDKSSEDALRSFLEVLPGARVLVILTYRPEYVPSWGARSYHSQIILNRFSNRESLAMLNHLLGTGEMSGDLEEIVLEKTEGVPLFIEEFVRSFKDLNIMVKKNDHYELAKGLPAVAVPSTLQEVIMARVDSLPEGARELLQTASVIDRAFSHELIKRASDLTERELLSRLSVLKNAELLHERDIYPRTTYIFKHALTREVVYDSLLIRRKKQLHEKIGRAIEHLHRNNLVEYTDVLAEHFIKSENFEKGAEFACLAGKKARQRSAYHNAISCTHKELFCLEKLPDSPAVQKKIMDARISLANYCMNLNDHVRAYEVVSPIAELASGLHYRKGLPPIYTAIGSYLLFVEEDYPQGMEYMNQAMQFAEEVQDYFSLWNACYILGTTLSWNCEFQKALSFFQKSLDLSLTANNLTGISAAKINTGVNYLFQGKIDLAHQVSLEALSMAEESGDIYVQGMAHSYYGTACYYRGLFSEAEGHLLQGIALGEKTTHFTWGSWSSAFLGDMYFDLGEYEKALRAYSRAFSSLEKRKFGPSWLNLIGVAMARAKTFKGDRDIDLSEIMESFARNRNRGFAGWLAQYISEILLQLDREHTLEAREWVEKAIELDRKNGMRLLLAKDYALAAKILQRMGDLEGSRVALARAAKIFEECGAGGYLKRAGQEVAAQEW
jgi:class 3 adenylate cyclase/tetratricopeptide (TPR) repeat protein